MIKERLKVLDKIYWMRVLVGGLAGIVCGMTFDLVNQPNTSLVMLVTFYGFSIIIALFMDKKGLAGKVKVYLHGIGIFLLLWFLVFSLYLTLLHYLF
jgi:hypothetical protein